MKKRRCRAPLPITYTVAGSADQLAVVGGGEQPGSIGRIGQLELDHPAVRVRGRIDLLRGSIQGLVDLDDRARERGIDIGGGLDRFNDAKRVAGFVDRANLGQLNKGDVAQAVLGVVGNTDHRGAIGRREQPFVGLGVFQFGWDITHGMGKLVLL